MATDEQSWIEDGTADTEPVTTETPDTEPTETAPEPVEAAPEPVEAPESAEPTDAEVAEAVEAGAETAEEVQAYIEGKLGDEPYKIPEEARLPLKRGDETEYLPVSEIMKRGMMEKDYRVKTEELSQQRRQFQAQQESWEREKARMEAREKHLAEKEEEIRAALTDPQGARAYEEHLQQYQNNPMYRKHVDAALAQRETDAELQSLKSERDSRIVQEASQTAASWVQDLSEDFPNVDPNRVRTLYGQRLQAGQASLDRAEVRAIYQSEADYLERASSPLRDTLAELRAKVEAMEASQAAEKQNETTQHAVERSKAPKVATGRGAPAKTPTKKEKFGPNELSDKNAEWVRAG